MSVRLDIVTLSPSTEPVPSPSAPLGINFAEMLRINSAEGRSIRYYYTSTRGVLAEIHAMFVTARERGDERRIAGMDAGRSPATKRKLDPPFAQVPRVGSFLRIGQVVYELTCGKGQERRGRVSYPVSGTSHTRVMSGCPDCGKTSGLLPAR